VINAIRLAASLAAFQLLSACGSSESTDQHDPEPVETAIPLAPGEFPANLAAFGDGYPGKGDPCRKLGESEVTSNWLDDSFALVGCPTSDSADALGGSIVETVDGFFLVTIPLKREARDEAKALLESGGFHATGSVRCAVDDPEFVEECTAGVRRNWGPEGATLVEVTKPDGSRRALFFDGAAAYGAETDRADGSAGWKFRARHMGGKTVITFGPERYAIPDELVIG
jgi:hypothetical protein